MKTFFLIIFGAYFIVSLLLIEVGMLDSEKCESRSFKNIEYVFPAYRAGCWLFSPVEYNNEM